MLHSFRVPVRFPGPRLGLCIASALGALALGACGDSHTPTAGAPTSSPNSGASASNSSSASGSSVTGAAGGQSAAPAHDPRVFELADAFESGRIAEVESGLLALSDGGGIEGELLRARLASARGDEISALRTLEAAKRAAPRDVRVLATSAELHAIGGRLGAAEDDIRAGLALAPESAELRRARGVLLISKPGGAQAGLDHLLAARAADPKVPYARRPLAEAHRLAATAALTKKDPELALRHVAAALAELPDQPDLELLGADAQMMLANFDAALATYEKLHAAGRDVGATLAQSSKTAAIAALLAQDRPLALKRFLRARELGLSADALGSGATMLADEAKAELERGWTAFDAQDFPAATSHFKDALRFDPASLDARRALGAALYSSGDADGAATQWKLVLETARARGIELAEPLVLDLARALHRLQRVEELRQLLETELAARPDGPAAAEAREMLSRLGAPASR
ncbi:MAG: hypothetical protein L6Q99_20005 [Planctomycetes bacterium]|nr:hypothetical protein [Planctomycetota bacterium]